MCLQVNKYSWKKSLRNNNLRKTRHCLDQLTQCWCNFGLGPTKSSILCHSLAHTHTFICWCVKQIERSQKDLLLLHMSRGMVSIPEKVFKMRIFVWTASKHSSTLRRGTPKLPLLAGEGLTADSFWSGERWFALRVWLPADGVHTSEVVPPLETCSQYKLCSTDLKKNTNLSIEVGNGSGIGGGVGVNKTKKHCMKSSQN